MNDDNIIFWIIIGLALFLLSASFAVLINANKFATTAEECYPYGNLNIKDVPAKCLNHFQNNG